VSNQRDAALSILFYCTAKSFTCFGCPLHPSSGVHKTVVITTGTVMYRISRPIWCTFFPPRKMWPKFDLRLMRRG